MAVIRHHLGKTYYLRKGRNHPKRLPLIGLHGGPGGTLQVNLNLLQLAGQRKVILYDQLGSGGSTKRSKRSWSMSLFVEELACLIDKLKLESFHLYGLSCGATLALEYYLKTGDRRIASIIFHSPFFSARIWMRDAKRLLAKLPKREREVIRLCEKVGATDAEVYRAAQRLYYSRHIHRKQQKSTRLRKAIRKGNREIYRYLWGPNEFRLTGRLKTYERYSSLSKVDVPAMVMCGQYDEATPKSCRMFASAMQNATLKVLPKCSHVSLEENPRLTLDTIKRWLQVIEA